MPKETTFHQELRKDMLAQGVILKKVPDVPVSRVQKHMSQDGLKEFRFSPPKFVDLVGVGNEMATAGDSSEDVPWGRPLIWEVKLMKKLNAWPLKSLGEEQLRILLDFQDRADARILINYRVKDFTARQIDKGGLESFVERNRICTLTSVLPSDILEAIQRGWKSIPLAELAKSFIRRPWGGQWNYTDIIMRSIWIPLWPSDSHS